MMKRQTTAAIRAYRLSGVLSTGLFLVFSYPSAPFGQSAHAGQMEKQPLRYRLIVSEPTVCRGEGIDLELELQNTTNHRVLIDPTALLDSVMSTHGNHVFGSGSIRPGKIPPDQLVALEPGASYRKTTSYPLKGEFFSAGIFSFKATYRQTERFSPQIPDLYIGFVESNRVLFEIQDCG